MKPIIGGVFGAGTYALQSLASERHGLWEVWYFVIHVESESPVGQGDTKTTALADARRVLTEKSPQILAQYFAEGKAKREAERIEEERRAAEFRAFLEANRAPSINRQRRKVFDKAGGACFYCNAKLDFDGVWHVEHMTPRSRGGSSHMSNLTAACVPCNYKKRTRTAEEFKAA